MNVGYTRWKRSMRRFPLRGMSNEVKRELQTGFSAISRTLAGANCLLLLPRSVLRTE
jgi:hypothetical protein